MRVGPVASTSVLAVKLSQGEYLFYEVTVGGEESAFSTLASTERCGSTDFPDHPHRATSG